MRFARLVSLAFFAVIESVAPVNATPANKKALADLLGPFAPTKGFDCRTCHVADSPTPDAYEHNAFGARLAEVRKDLRKAGKPTDLRSRLELIADEDSDGDGVANLVELLTGHSPGDAADKPSAAELKDIDTKRNAFRKYLAAYQWRPFEPVRRPAVPIVGETHPVDAFLTAARRAEGLAPRPEASKTVLLRRLYLDLIGLPPSRDAMTTFLGDPSPDAT